ncbi:hypothetical protein CDO52_04355 [Nocardiopsis gilva YIM 90087]|uniref:N-acetyltransferase domain-containing protein n=1 Tax=Nocardiopsis gilva YIM 90087 TaxID=1235441 RepID=A0A223S1W3_9ACTN|nr:hypothetical protein CDO52_04355 [Nocardiopsis gilva YIM 90087]
MGAVPEGHRAAAGNAEIPEPSPSSVPEELFPADAVAGVKELWVHTRGEPEVTIGVVESPPDMEHPSLAGSEITMVDSWWMPAVTPEDGAMEHGTYTASVLFGQPGSVLEGLAPRCRGLICPALRDNSSVLDPLNAARAIEELTEAGADIVLFMAAHPAPADGNGTFDLVRRAVEQASQAGVLVTAPAGNDYGRNPVAPALLPEVLAVGAHRADGTMYKFSNWGDGYHGHGIAAPGGEVLGAAPGGGVKAQKGTCVAVSMATGAAALLLSLQRKAGLSADPLGVREALLRTARSCDPEIAHDDTGRCLNGKLDLPAAARMLVGEGVLSSNRTSGAGAAVPSSASAVRLCSPTTAAKPARSPAATPKCRKRMAAAGDETARSDTRITTFAERPELVQSGIERTPPGPGFLQRSLADRWEVAKRLCGRFPQFGVAATRAVDGSVVGHGIGVPLALSASGRGHLPGGGGQEMLAWALCDERRGVHPDTLGLLGMTIHPEHRGTGLSRSLLQALKEAARSAGLREVVTSVRPTAKHRRPAEPMAHYARRTHRDGLPCDPCLRVHAQAGGRITSVAPSALVVSGPLAKWRQWTGLPFDAPGPVHVPLTLAPVRCDPAQDRAVYVEPHVWVRHALD